MAKILIVDDEPRIRELIHEHLQYSGYICEEAGDGSAALAQLSGGGFDLVILDLMMPFMDGMTCLSPYVPHAPRSDGIRGHAACASSCHRTWSMRSTPRNEWAR